MWVDDLDYKRAQPGAGSPPMVNPLPEADRSATQGWNIDTPPDPTNRHNVDVDWLNAQIEEVNP